MPYCDSAFLDEFGELVAFFKREGVLLALANGFECKEVPFQ